MSQMVNNSLMTNNSLEHSTTKTSQASNSNQPIKSGVKVTVKVSKYNTFMKHLNLFCLNKFLNT